MAAVEEDLETCAFDKEGILNHLMQLYEKIKSTTRNELRNARRRFARRFELALIWDTLVRGTPEPKFFKADDEQHPNNKKEYVVLRNENGAISIGSVTGITKRNEMQSITVDVKYTNPIYGEHTYICNFGDTLSHLRTMLGADEADFNYQMNKLVFFPQDQGTEQFFRNPKVSCGKEIKLIFDGELAKNLFPQSLLKKINESYEWTEKVKENEANAVTKIRLEMTDFKVCVKKITYMMQESIENEKNKFSELVEAYRYCAKVNYIYCDQVAEEEDQDQAKIWENFGNMACLLYDHLLMWKAWKAWIARPVAVPQTHDDKDRSFMKIPNVIYLITCTSCDVRYVGKTKNSIAERYTSGSKAKEKNHFKQTNHNEVFYILQIVAEESLFPENHSFNEYVRDNPVDLEGIEMLWIDLLIDKEKGDLNIILNFTYGEKHRRHMSVLLRHYICKHKVVYTVAHKVVQEAATRSRRNTA